MTEEQNDWRTQQVERTTGEHLNANSQKPNHENHQRKHTKKFEDERKIERLGSSKSTIPTHRPQIRPTILASRKDAKTRQCKVARDGLGGFGLNKFIYFVFLLPHCLSTSLLYVAQLNLGPTEVLDLA